MLKKIFLCVFSVMVFAMSGAHAAEIAPREDCVVKNGGLYWPGTDASVDPSIRADYVIYFDHDGSDIPSNCNKDVNDLVETLVEQKNDIETVLLFGVTDSTGSAKPNAKLGQARANTVAKLLKDNGIATCEYDDKGKFTSDRCARISIGESLFSAVGRDNLSHELGRAVFMFVIYKGDVCDDATIKTLDALIAKTSGDIKTGLVNAKDMCGDYSGVLLLRSGREQIMSAINAAVEKYPNLANLVDGNISIKILVQNIENARQSLASDASVWRTADGKFNVARLASDSIAGVVLGTAGGIITSNVVKKNQVKRGFDDVMCTVGGQSVADWGDEFRVGIR